MGCTIVSAFNSCLIIFEIETGRQITCLMMTNMRDPGTKLRTPPIRVSKLALWGCMLVVLLLARSLDAQQDSGPNFRFDSGHSAFKIPFELHNNLIFVRVCVNGSAPLWFLIDSGAEISVIKTSRAKGLGLEFEDEGKTDAAGGSVEFRSVRNVTLSLPGAKILGPTVVAFPLETFELILGRTVDGILGADLFNRFVVEIEYANRTVNLYDPRQYQYYGSGTEIPLSVKEDTPFVRMLLTQKCVGTIEGIFAIDTGSDSTIKVNSPFAKTHKLVESTRTIESSGLGAGGETRSLVGRVREIRLGNIVMKNPVAQYSQDEKGDLASSDYSGIIGGELLRRFRVIFDYSHSRIILEPNLYLSEPDEFDMSGIIFGFEAPDFKVLKIDKVMKNSPASRAGLSAGDIVESIDGKPASALIGPNLRQMFKVNQKKYLFEIRRGERSLRIKIALKRLI